MVVYALHSTPPSIAPSTGAPRPSPTTPLSPSLPLLLTYPRLSRKQLGVAVVMELARRLVPSPLPYEGALLLR